MSLVDIDMVRMVLYAFLGRTLYPLHLLDQWQKVPCILGDAGTGKSRIIELIQAIFYSEDTSTIANMTEATFGLANHFDVSLGFYFWVGGG